MTHCVFEVLSDDQWRLLGKLGTVIKVNLWGKLHHDIKNGMLDPDEIQ